MATLSGRTCLITGASSGFGEHFARILADAGARLVLGARRRDRVDALVANLRESGATALAVTMDVTDEASIAAAYDAGEAAFGTIDTIIANAGVVGGGRSTEVSAEATRRLIDTNVIGAFLTAREGARRLIAAGSRETGRGRILLIGSIGADVPIRGELMYCVSKAAVATMGRNMAREWVRDGITVNVLQPGFIQTELSGGWFETAGGQAQIAGFPRKRLQPIGSLDEMVRYLCSDASAAMTGSVVSIDDGQYV